MPSFNMVANTTPGATFGQLVLLTDGTVLCHQPMSTTWHRLTPNREGDYSQGRWSTTTMHQEREGSFAAAVLRDGRLLVVGDMVWPETRVPAGVEIFDPVTNLWSAPRQPPPEDWGYISFAPCCVLADGRVLVGFANGGITAIFDPYTENPAEIWTRYDQAQRCQQSWTLLPSGDVLSFGDDGSVERFSTDSTGRLGWFEIPRSLGVVGDDPYFSSPGARGGALLLDPRREVPPGDSGLDPEFNYVVITSDRPRGTPANRHVGAYVNIFMWDHVGSQSTWAFPSGFGIPTGGAVGGSWGGAVTMRIAAWMAACQLPDRGARVLQACRWRHDSDPTVVRLHRTTYFEAALPSSDSTIDLPGSDTGGRICMAILPSLRNPHGEVLISNGGSQLWIYQNDAYSGPPRTHNRPMISVPRGMRYLTLTRGSNRVSGTGFNGVTQGTNVANGNAATNYPIALLESTTGAVYYCRTSGHSSTSVDGSATSTYVNVPNDVPLGPLDRYSLYLIANGVVSAGVPVRIDVAV